MNHNDIQLTQAFIFFLVGMDWDCPAWTSLLGKQIVTQGHADGTLTAEKTIRYVNPIVQTGNLHVAIYEPDNSIFYLSHSIGSKMDGPKYAYERPYLRLNASYLFSIPFRSGDSQ